HITVSESAKGLFHMIGYCISVDIKAYIHNSWKGVRVYVQECISHRTSTIGIVFITMQRTFSFTMNTEEISKPIKKHCQRHTYKSYFICELLNPVCLACRINYYNGIT
ncbi:hypothetical protein STEG23_017383, partial [Scotinomys teguina]